MAWIAECSGGVLWVNGVSGSGKSSLMGTLRELASDASGRNRLGAFIRYDRIESPDSSKLISSIAYFLGMSDDRIGTAISLVTHSSPFLASSEKERFELLIEQPLQSVPVLADEGPLVVIIDGLDECNPSDELLAVLANGFGSRLPFMRMVIASRPLESIVRAFSHSGITPITLDTSSEATRRDIRNYIDHQLSSIFADQEARHAPDTLQKMCEALIAVEGLSKRANGSFVWAVTACRFIREFPTITRLQTLLGLEIPTDCTDSIANLYKAILSSIVAESNEDKDIIRRCICTVLGAIMIPRRSGGMTAEILDALVLVPGDPPAYLILADLRAVVEMSLDGFARFFDMSFYDFLRDRDQCGEEWYIDVEERKKIFYERSSVMLRG
ncbi:uncharacterized protein BT62DRAFT_574791 [Guyanagaster necrorhizus]|uniref:NACHT domain-containing protein n=1 Tax=Guyanagaster necrorhizus TaxID=856835 RepID=A0A9P8ALV9_9AGAR|nr:uncharacterized protein BT62DRAFT_574791 [Guyanagaster necrorhizus MCA 3950]KAG7440643.1 hypothetical protein BT62DRAFT_574791 [Guyanagaster necrorhizus MCA 3950]